MTKGILSLLLILLLSVNLAFAEQEIIPEPKKDEQIDVNLINENLRKLDEKVYDQLRDKDNNTKIQVEESDDEDIVRIDVNGTEAFQINADGVITAVKQSACRAYLNTHQDITHSTWTKVLLDAENYDIQGEFASYKFTATVAGLYQVNAAGLWEEAVGAGNQTYISIYVNGSAVATEYYEFEALAWCSMGVSDTVQLAVDDYVELYVKVDYTEPRFLYNGSALTYMSVAKLH